jgi:hypothetical protein
MQKTKTTIKKKIPTSKGTRREILKREESSIGK